MKAKLNRQTCTHICSLYIHTPSINSLCTLEVAYISLSPSPPHSLSAERFLSEDFITGARFSQWLLRHDIFSEDNSNGIVPTAQVVSLLGDSSAFLKELSLWLKALFQHPWHFKKLCRSLRGTASQIPHVVTSWRWEWSLPAEVTQDIRLMFNHLWTEWKVSWFWIILSGIKALIII